MMNFLTGCVGRYNKRGIRQPIDAPGLQPWVEVTFANSNTTISVSNFSSAQTAAIVKSFKFGMSSGNGVEIEIVDEAGGQFAEFFARVADGNLTALDAAAVIGMGAAGPFNIVGALVSSGRHLMKFRFGWTATGCDGYFSGIDPRADCCPSTRSLVSCEHTMVVRKINTDVSNGMFKYTIEGTDFTHEVLNTRNYNVYGTDNNTMTVVSAIRTMFREIGIEVRFVRWDAACTTGDLQFRLDGNININEGSLATFRGMGMNPIQAASHWLSELVSHRGKGIIHFWDIVDGSQVLVFAETNRIGCDVNRNVDEFNLGTYIVGSKYSPVISFSPNVEYILSDELLQTHMFEGNALGGRTGTVDAHEPCIRSRLGAARMGQQSSFVGSPTSFRVYQGDANARAAQNVLTNRYANLIHRPISAEMRIQGDPSYDRPIFCQGNYVSVVFLRPFPVASRSGSCKWLERSSPCDNVLSSCKWMIRGINHQISPGSFVTVMSLFLPAPGNDIPVSNFVNC